MSSCEWGLASFPKGAVNAWPHLFKGGGGLTSPSLITKEHRMGLRVYIDICMRLYILDRCIYVCINDGLATTPWREGGGMRDGHHLIKSEWMEDGHHQPLTPEDKRTTDWRVCTYYYIYAYSCFPLPNDSWVCTSKKHNDGLRNCVSWIRACAKHPPSL